MREHKQQVEQFVRLQNKPIKELNEDYNRLGLVIKKVSNSGLFVRCVQVKYGDEGWK